MVERLQELMHHKQLSSTQFADTVEVPRAVISHILSGRNKPSLEVVTKVASAFPEVSLGWLLLGEGDMLNPLAAPVAPASKSKSEEVLPSQAKLEMPPAVEQQDKVQSTNSISSPAQLADQHEKTIEQIVIFYNDKSFTAYKP
ncbi:helix-turn-helix domain-containing protein [Pontibacter cellulosilyticus]|uniref:Helix-turn-helix transcriptional regulator n=1 Tax=Pontibacter cellulosilyticus TaxID=1720253 RepID=A0A923SHD6_9BACT|nr:helix-turn-helix transcriptional regulator [Pontibacter cellulosilyticus]MBC5991583.1 helix-turn-helix transcriptional regulator [Pontibacter cellulosilyticus]